ncbi:uncharacterized protein LOC106088039 [Stomoxys calcitrans]|uniref:uncharacterized protein LOC106088039 n=1 Tax=Stomoxys calcitrans TaxID=35570 RepID=UPI0027E21C4F|nr:uncharacterized protein LOC106088039 [Stomoxys calcitrans]
MLIMLKLCNFGTIYLWIFVLKVLQACDGQRIQENEGNVVDEGGRKELTAMLSPYQRLHYTDDLLHERDGVWWQIPAKYKQHPVVYESLTFAPLPTTTTTATTTGSSGVSGKTPSNDISFENSKDFDLYQMAKLVANADKRTSHQLRHRFPLLTFLTPPANILYEKDNERSPPDKYAKDKTKRTLWLNELHEIDNGGNTIDPVAADHATNLLKKLIFPLPSLSKSNGYPLNDMVGPFNSNNGPGNENLNDFYDMKHAMYTNYRNTPIGDESGMASLNTQQKRNGPPRDKKPKPETITPYLPAISAGSMVNLGKFFRDLSKNVQFSEKYQWSADDQKLLEGDPHFGNLQHHFSEPEVTTDRTGEWIKAIRFYRPSQKIRSLVEMNPHGQWAHGSNFIDPNYMWMGLGK